MSFLSLLGVSELNVDVLNIDTINLSSIDPYSILETDEKKNVVGRKLTDGQLIIGSTDAPADSGFLDGSSNIVVTNGPGSIGIDTIQNINTLASPEWATVKLNNLNATSLVGSNASKQLQSLTLASNNGVVSGVAGNTLTVSTAQDIRSSARPSWSQINVLNGNNAIHNTASFTPTGLGNTALGGYESMGFNKVITNSNNTAAGAFSLRNLASGGTNCAYGYDTLVALTNQSNNTAIGGAAGRNATSSNSTFLGAAADATGSLTNVTCIGYQAAATASNTMALGNSLVTSIIPGSNGLCDLGSSSRMFKNLYIDDVIVDNLISTRLVATDTNKKLQSITIANSNANGTNNTLSFTGSTITMSSSMNQNLDINSNPSFANPYITGTPLGGVLVVNAHPLINNRQVYGLGPAYGKIMIGTFDYSNVMTYWNAGSIHGSSNITASVVSDYTGSDTKIELDTIQPITSSSTPTFANLVLSGTTPRITYDVGDYQEYDQTGNRYQFNIGNTPCFQISASDVSSSLPFVASNGSIQLALTTITAPVIGAPRTHTIPFTSNSEFVMTNGSQTLNSKFFSSALLPSTTGTLDIGSASAAWRDLYLEDGTGIIRLGHGIRQPTRAELYLNSNGDSPAEIMFGINARTDANNKWGFSSRSGGEDNTFILYRCPLMAGTYEQVWRVAGSTAQTQFVNTVDASSTTTGAFTCAGGVSIGKKLYVGTGIYLPTSGGTPSELNHYEEFTHVTSWNGAFSSTTGNIALTRVGRVVTARFPQIVNICASVGTINMITALPTRFRPSANMRLTGGMVQTNPATNDYGVFFVTSFGSISIYHGPMSSFTDIGQTIGVSDACCVTWSV